MQRDGRACETTGVPFVATLERVAALETEGIRLSACLGVPDEPGWVTVADLATDRVLLAGIVGRIGRGYGTDDRAFAGTTLLRDCLWRVLAAAVAALLSERRLPDLHARNVGLRFGEDGLVADLAFARRRFFALPDDPEAGHPDAVVVPSDGALLAEIRAALSETYLPALIPALRGLRVRRGTRVLQCAAADVCAEAFMFVGRGLGREAEGCALAERLLAGPSPLSSPTNYYVLRYPGGSEMTRVRNTCCLYYKVGSGTCFTCPRTSNEERLLRLEKEQEGSSEPWPDDESWTLEVGAR
jgi:hypothetical protein